MPLRAPKSTKRYRGCGDKNCIWCSENRQNKKINEKLKAKIEFDDYWFSSIQI